MDSILASAHTFKGDATYGWVANLLDNKAIRPSSRSRKAWIAAAVTPTDTSAAVALVGVQPADIHLG